MQATQTIDPACPRTTESALVTAVRALSWVVLVVSVAGGLYVLAVFRRADIVTGVGSPLPVPTYETVTNWPAIGLGLGLCLQGLVVWAVLQALASIAQDVTGIRISARAAATRAPLLLLALALTACDGSSTSPERHTFPEVAGVYDVTGSLPAFEGAAISGTFTLYDDSRETPEFTGAYSLAAHLPGRPSRPGDAPSGRIVDGWVTEDGAIRFRLEGEDSDHEGTISGGTISGTFSRAYYTSNLGGTFTARRR